MPARIPSELKRRAAATEILPDGLSLPAGGLHLQRQAEDKLFIR